MALGWRFARSHRGGTGTGGEDAPESSAAEEKAGADPGRSELHYRRLGAAIAQEFTAGNRLVLVTDWPVPNGELIARFIDEENDKGFRAVSVSCRAGMKFPVLVQALNRQLGLTVPPESEDLHTLASHIMASQSRGITRALVFEHAEALEPRTYRELLRFRQLTLRLVPMALSASPAFSAQLDTPPFEALKAAISARITFDRLAAEEGEIIEGSPTPDPVAIETEAPDEVIAETEPEADVIAETEREVEAPVAASAAAALAEDPPEVERVTVASTPEADPLDVLREWAKRTPQLPALAWDDRAAARVPLSRARRGPSRRLPVAVTFTCLIVFGAPFAIQLFGDRDFQSKYVTPALELTAAARYYVAPVVDRAVAAVRDDAVPAVERLVAEGKAWLAGKPWGETAEADPPVAAPRPAAPKPAEVPPAALASPPAAAPAVEPVQAAARVADAAPSPSGTSEPKPAAAPAATAAAAPAAIEREAPAPRAQGAAPAQVAALEVAPQRMAESAKAAAQMVRRGNKLLRAKDILAARRFFERAAEEGDAAGLCGVGQTFDPVFLKESGTWGVAGDAATAAQWYGKAAKAGSAEAAARLHLLVGLFPQLAMRQEK